MKVFLSPAHASDDQQRADGAEAEYVSVGAEGSDGVGAGPRGAEPAVPPPAERSAAAVLTGRGRLPLYPSTSAARTVPLGPVYYPRDGRPELPLPVGLLCRL